ncbi:riboflavin biosynthesis protein RibD [Actinoplanes philippinensis]|uniref:RibD C-terminal domain-containing protein n=1 Tax=Actinoplanes philippinensis TaxID=35752 RepID=A0A1I2KTL7_9ACTN|nr:dihydrofolate reductase family protein [Actinoplanes philippinensis]GIE82113.1 riboflavin biosynthesis protein RibD [Actinoplanes philippinensis]SFF69600.1 RibD C-terminal domain-containing protein [Actinoplanes philippinensis]
MGDVIVTQFVTLDGVVSDPDGRWGTGHGGWAFRHGTGPVGDDRFRLGERMAAGVQLYGRRTWEHFARLWPGREGDFARLMNTVPKRVATRTGIDAGAWSNSAAIDGDPVRWAARERAVRDVVVVGSLSLVRSLAAAGEIDEYRLVTYPTVAGAGDALFAGHGPADFTVTLTEPAGPAVLTVLRRTRAGAKAD